MKPVSKGRTSKQDTSETLHEHLAELSTWYGEDLSAPELATKLQSKATSILNKEFGVGDLSVSEGVLLRHCVTRCLSVWAQDMCASRRGEISYSASLHTPQREAAYLWLNVAYDVDEAALRIHKALNKSAPPEFREWLRRTRESAICP